jgi:serine phosphatase RsbU (regulator of sigma subunit)
MELQSTWKSPESKPGNFRTREKRKTQPFMQEVVLERFVSSLPSRKKAISQDVKEYIDWGGVHGGDGFKPDSSDDAAIRTYLLDRHLKGEAESALDRIRSSLEKFYAWLKLNGLVEENPFEKYNLKSPFISKKQLRVKHDAFAGSSVERELAQLRALNRLAESTNRVPDVQSMLNDSLVTLLEVMDLNTAWISLKVDAGFLKKSPGEPPAHGFALAAAHNLPPSLEQSNRYYLTRPPACNCQKLLNAGRLKRGINIVECSRLQEAASTGSATNDLMFHASVPINCNGQIIGVMNVAAKEWQFLSASDLQFMTAGARQIGGALERAHLYDQVQTQQTHLANELNMARKVQISLLPDKLPRIRGYGLAAYWKPAYETSGDYYNVCKLPGGRWGFIVADVSDKGAPAALYMAIAHGLIRERVEYETSPAALLTKVNRALFDLDIKTNFVTSFYGILDPSNSRLKYAIAGHPPPLLRKASGQVETLAGKGIAMGIIQDVQYEEMGISLAPGESLVTFTDGLTDANNSRRETFELSQLKKAVGSAPASPNALMNHLKNTLGDWVKEEPNYDDITILVIGRKLQSPSNHNRSEKA